MPLSVGKVLTKATGAGLQCNTPYKVDKNGKIYSPKSDK